MKVLVNTGVQEYWTIDGIVNGSFYKVPTHPSAVFLKLDKKTSVKFEDGQDAMLAPHCFLFEINLLIHPLSKNYAITIGG